MINVTVTSVSLETDRGDPTGKIQVTVRPDDDSTLYLKVPLGAARDANEANLVVGGRYVLKLAVESTP